MLRNSLQGFILRHVGCIHHSKDSAIGLSDNARMRGERLLPQLAATRRHNGAAQTTDTIGDKDQIVWVNTALKTNKIISSNNNTF